MRYVLPALAALLTCATGAMAQTAPVVGPTTTLEGSRSDWTATPIAGGGVVLRSKYGVEATVYKNFRFRLEQWVWNGSTLVPLSPSMGCVTAPAAPTPSTQDQADLALGRAVRGLVKP